METIKAKDIKAAKIKARCTNDFWSYCKLMTPKIFGTKDREKIFYKLAKYISNFFEEHDVLGEVDINFLSEEELEDLIKHIKINLATFPRAGKSFFIAHFISWIIGKYPNIRVMIVCRSDDLSSEYIKMILNLIGKNFYKLIFPKLEKVVDNANVIGVRELGSDIKKPKTVYASGIDGQLTGFGANIVVVDDIYKNHDEAFSSVRNQKVKDTYSSAITTRLEGLVRLEIHIGTRWSKNELFAELEKKNFYDFQIKTPAYDEERKRSLFPTIHSTEKLEFEREMNEVVFASAYQQSAIDNFVKLFKKSHFTKASKYVAGSSNRIMIIDPARGGGDNLALGVWANQADGRDVLEEGVLTNEDSSLTRNWCYAYAKHYEPRIIYIETNNDRALYVFLKELLMIKTNTGILVKEFISTKKKHDKIFNNTGNIKSRTLLDEAMDQDKHYQNFMENVYDFHYETRQKDDAADLLAIKEELTRDNKEFLRALMGYKYGGVYERYV